MAGIQGLSVASIEPASLRFSLFLPILQMVAFQRAMAKYGIVELVRTGRISLQRGAKVFKGSQDELEYHVIAQQVRLSLALPAWRCQSGAGAGAGARDEVEYHVTRAAGTGWPAGRLPRQSPCAAGEAFVLARRLQRYVRLRLNAALLAPAVTGPGPPTMRRRRWPQRRTAATLLTSRWTLMCTGAIQFNWIVVGWLLSAREVAWSI